MARPKKKRGSKKTSHISIPVSPKVKRELQAIAKAEHLSLASWARKVLIEAADGDLG